MHILINTNTDTPIYEQIVEGIKEYILEGQLKSGELLPSIRRLAKDLNISVITTKRAYEELERQNFITVVPAKGSYVKIKSDELVKEDVYKKVELKLTEVIEISKKFSVSKIEIIDIINTLYDE